MCTLPDIIMAAHILVNGVVQPPFTNVIRHDCIDTAMIRHDRRVNPFRLHIIIHNLHVYGRWRKEKAVHIVTAKDCHKNAKLKACRNG